MTHSNFIVARLSDVDFNRILQDSLATIANQALEEKWTDEGLKTALSRHMTGLAICRDSVKGQLDSEFTDCCKLLEYFNKKITLEFSNKRPEANINGSAYFDVNLKQAFLF